MNLLLPPQNASAQYMNGPHLLVSPRAHIYLHHSAEEAAILDRTDGWVGATPDPETEHTSTKIIIGGRDPLGRKTQYALFREVSTDLWRPPGGLVTALVRSMRAW